MAEDSFTEITSESWFSRIGGAIKEIVTDPEFDVAAMI
jgi:hypothetical protein